MSWNNPRLATLGQLLEVLLTPEPELSYMPKALPSLQQ
jgi:hypothetical protein